MNKPLTFLLLFSFPIMVYSQRTADLGLSVGAVNYVGDLGNEKHFPFSSLAPGSAVTISGFLNNPEKSGTRLPAFDLQFRISWHRLQYDETSALNGRQGDQLRNYLRGLSFRNDLIGTEAGLTYNFYPRKNIPLTKPQFSFFLMAGVGVFWGTPKADLFRGDPSPGSRYYFWNDGTIRDIAQNATQTGNIIEKDGEYETSLNEWMTEGQGYNKEIHKKQPYDNCNIGFPVGFGIHYRYNPMLTISAEFNYYFFLTDYLDDVSGSYATFEELKANFTDPMKYEMAKYISDPTGKGTNGLAGPATSPRGNPDLKDAFTFVSLQVSYKITWRKKGIYGQ
ncbi:MAG: hypothetical protein IT242_11880 [Bacteroidia bacterium]|nr:hypothetical protein [Bacteroidia bacterium]